MLLLDLSYFSALRLQILRRIYLPNWNTIVVKQVNQDVIRQVQFFKTFLQQY